MWKKIAIGGAVAAAILGAGTASLAVTGDTPTTSGTGSAAPGPATPNGTPPGHPGHRPPGLGRGLGERTLHGQFVTQDPKTKQVVTHDVIRGTVTAVSATSITVKAADNVSFTYTVNTDTVVRMRTPGQHGPGTTSAIGNVKSGDKVVVLGTGTAAPFVAKHILDGAD